LDDDLFGVSWWKRLWHADRRSQPLSRMDLGAVVIPLGTTNGTTNAVVFGMGLMGHRDEQLNLIPKIPEQFVHHDMDAPPWWNVHKKPSLYIDGFAQKGHRALMQFMLIPENGPQFFREREGDFRDVYALLDSLRPPKFEGPIDSEMATRGRVVFESSCAECHGTYGDHASYPNRRIPIEEIGTDPVRLTALTVEGRQKYGRSWFAHAGELNEHETVTDPNGYIAPPLDGIWASPPYFHNGSVPTLWHVLHPSERPVVWRRTDQEIDDAKVGFRIEQLDHVPREVRDPILRRSYFDTRRFGKSHAGHDYPDQLTEAEKTDLLEYLKTL
jgi:mono/diheme cytochrome c family protein